VRASAQPRGQDADDHLEAPRPDTRRATKTGERTQGAATITGTVSIDLICFDFP
jgi:hypothetical protein